MREYLINLLDIIINYTGIVGIVLSAIFLIRAILAFSFDKDYTKIDDIIYKIVIGVVVLFIIEMVVHRILT